jgi:hypothetical protein
MANSDRKTDWSGVNQAIQKRASDTTLPLHPDRPLEVPASIQPPPEPVAKPDGVVTQYKANKITRRAALEHLEVWYKAQLEVARHRLTEVARVRKAEATQLAEQFLHSINSQHLQFLAELGLRNEDARNRAFLALGDQTSNALREIQERDWPPQMIESTIQAVMDRYSRFFAKLSHELGE